MIDIEEEFTEIGGITSFITYLTIQSKIFVTLGRSD